MANALTLLMPLLPGSTAQQLTAALQAKESDSTGTAPQGTDGATSDTVLNNALESLGIVHYARFLVLDRSSPNLQPSSPTTPSDQLVLAVITEYDGSFDAYIGDFVSQVGDIFDMLLEMVVDGKKVTPVANNIQAFTNFVKANDLSQQPGVPQLYQAYTATVQQIKASV